MTKLLGEQGTLTRKEGRVFLVYSPPVFLLRPGHIGELLRESMA